MRVSIHQPEFLPWPGFFHKMSQVDLFVILDTVQFRKNYFQNRNRIYSPDKGETYLTVPVVMKGYQEKALSEMSINYIGGSAWVSKNWRQLEHSYGSHSYFPAYANELQSILFSGDARLIDLNMKLIYFFREALAVETPIIFASSLKVEGRKSELIMDVLRKTGATSYLSGPSGKDYLNQESFDRAGVALSFHSFSPPIYEGKGYRPYLSSLDVLMNCGPRSREVVMSGGNLQR